jgi:predicted N-acetyltransferase YhbS
MREALSLADERAEPFVVVVGAQAFYETFGFVPAASHGIRGPYDDGAGENVQVRARPGVELKPGAVSYPAAFNDI